MVLRVLTAISIFASTGVSAAPPVEEEVRRKALELSEQGTTEFKSRNYDAAASRFKAAYDTYPDPAFLFNIALCYERRGRWRLAVDYYDRFLVEAPDSPAVPDITRKREAAARAREAEMATVRVTTGPAGAQVEAASMGDPVRCVSPCSLRVDPGPVVVTATLGTASARATRTLDVGETWEPPLSFEATSPLGSILVRIDVAGATARLAEREIASGYAVAWPAGTHRLVVSHPDHAPFEADVAIEPDRTRIVEVHLRSSGGGESQRLAAWITLGVSGAALVGGAVFASLALTEYLDGQDVADSGADPNGRLPGIRSTVDRWSLAADVSFGVALAGGVAGLVLWLTSTPAEREAAEPWTPTVVRF